MPAEWRVVSTVSLIKFFKVDRSEEWWLEELEVMDAWL